MQCQANRSYAGAAPRMAAYMVDALIVGVVASVVSGPLNLLKHLGVSLVDKKILFNYTIVAILVYLVQKAYYIFFTATTGQTFGKMLFRIKVVNADGSKVTFWNIVYRETIGRFLAGLSQILWIGYIMIIVDVEKRGLHDRLCDTRVIYDEKVNDENYITWTPNLNNNTNVGMYQDCQNMAKVPINLDNSTMFGEVKTTLDNSFNMQSININKDDVNEIKLEDVKEEVIEELKTEEIKQEMAEEINAKEVKQEEVAEEINAKEVKQEEVAQEINAKEIKQAEMTEELKAKKDEKVENKENIETEDNNHEEK